MKQSLAQVEHVTKLAQLGFLTDQEKELSREQLPCIPELTEHLKQVTTDGVSPTVTVLTPGNVMRDTEVNGRCHSRKCGLTPLLEDGGFSVPAVLEREAKRPTGIRGNPDWRHSNRRPSPRVHAAN